MSRVLLAWSSGKDSAWVLHKLRQSTNHEVVALVTTLSEDVQRVAMHSTRCQLLRQQAAAVGLPVIEVEIPRPCSNEEYESRFGASLLEAARRFDANTVAFGDLYLEDIRQYREQHLEKLGLVPLFPLWGTDTCKLANEMLLSGLQAITVCVDSRVMPKELAGQSFDHDFLQRLPGDVDYCGENGEFHTFCHAGPMFEKPIAVQVLEIVERDGFIFADVVTRTCMQ